MELLGVGAFEVLLVLVIALIVVGPQRFPELARQGGRWYRIARRYTAEITADLRGAMSDLENEVKSDTDDLRSIRDIGRELRSGMDETLGDLDSLAGDPGDLTDAGKDGPDASSAARGGPPAAEAGPAAQTPAPRGDGASPAAPAGSAGDPAPPERDSTADATEDAAPPREPGA